MKHEPEFSQPKQSYAQQQAKSRELAAVYAGLFLGSDDGQRVLADLRSKFGLERMVFVRGEQGQFDTISAAITEGERHVILEIENAIRLGTPSSCQINQQTKQNQQNELDRNPRTHRTTHRDGESHRACD